MNIIEDNHPLRLLTDLTPEGNPSLTSQALLPIASLLPAALIHSRDSGEPKHDTRLAWPEWVVEARPEIARADDLTALQPECRPLGKLPIDGSSPGGYIVLWEQKGTT